MKSVKFIYVAIPLWLNAIFFFSTRVYIGLGRSSSSTFGEIKKLIAISDLRSFWIGIRCIIIIIIVNGKCIRDFIGKNCLIDNTRVHSIFSTNNDHRHWYCCYCGCCPKTQRKKIFLRRATLFVNNRLQHRVRGLWRAQKVAHESWKVF